MEQNGIFISYQMAEAINLLTEFDPNTVEGKAKIEEALLGLKKRWLENDTIPGTTIKIGDKFAGMQDITLEEIIQASKLAKQAETYTLENAAAFQNVLIINENGEFSFDFTKLEEIIKLADQNEKKIIIDSAVVFGDHLPTKIVGLDRETISKLVTEYTRQLTSKYGKYIDRIDVLNSIFERNLVSPGNNAEEFWIEKFGDNYAQEIINLVRSSIDPNFPNIKLGWNEFYLTNSKFEQRKIDFLNQVQTIHGLDVIGVQDRFVSNESIDYVISSLDEISKVSRNSNKEVCITEFSCSASGYDLKNSNAETINTKMANILNAVKNYCSTNSNIKRIEGRLSDKFDFNYKQLKALGLDVSTTGNRNITPQNQIHDKPFDKMKQSEIQIYNQIKEKNQMIKEKKAQQKQIEKPKVKILTQPTANANSQNSNKGFTNIIILCLIASFVCGALFMVIYMLFGR